MPTEKQLSNLKPPFKKGEHREEQRLGGIASGKKRRELKEIREWAEQNLFKKIGEKKTPLYEMLFKKLEYLASQGNLKAIEMILNYSGLKPVDKVETTEAIRKVFITKVDEKEANEKIDNFINNEQ